MFIVDFPWTFLFLMSKICLNFNLWLFMTFFLLRWMIDVHFEYLNLVRLKILVMFTPDLLQSLMVAWSLVHLELWHHRLVFKAFLTWIVLWSLWVLSVNRPFWLLKVFFDSSTIDLLPFFSLINHALLCNC
jgi:hypothetical protein